MRDILLTVIVFAAIPRAILHPWFGIMLWVWISVMAPHRLTWTFAYHIPFAQVAAIATLIGLVFTKDRVKFPLTGITTLLILLPLWMSFTYLFALQPESAHDRWVEVMKVYFFVLVATSVLHTREHVHWLLWVLVVSVGFYGFKGGIFTIVTGGQYRVYGPPNSFITDNNAISVALIMTIPVMHYLAGISPYKIVRYGLWVTMLLSAASVLGSYSRGALLAISVMGLFLWLKGRQKVLIGTVLVAGVSLAILAMPEHWHKRMETIETYEEDTSAMSRINTWTMIINLANDRPLVGGGFEHYSRETFARYAPSMDTVHSAHSIYFQMLGEHGYVGLLLFFLLAATSWWTAKDIIRRGSSQPGFEWATSMARALQVSLIGYAVGGAFVNIAYWEPPYYEIIALMITRRLLLDAESSSTEKVQTSTSQNGQQGGRDWP